MIVVVETLDFRGRTLIVVEHGVVPAIIKVLECILYVSIRECFFFGHAKSNVVRHLRI